MKQVLDNIETKDFYSEMLYIKYRYNDIIKRPRKKVHRITNYLLTLEIFMGIYIILSIFNIVFRKNMFTSYLILIFVYIIIFLYFLIILIKSYNKISYYIKNDNKKEIKLDEKEICYSDNGKKIIINYEELKYVILNKYSMCFLTGNENNIIIVDKKHKEKILKYLANINKDNLIIDNTKLYK